MKKEQKLLQEEYKRRQKEEEQYNAELNRLIKEEQERQRKEAQRLEKARQDSIREAKKKADAEAKKLNEQKKKKDNKKDNKKDSKKDNKKDKAEQKPVKTPPVDNQKKEPVDNNSKAEKDNSKQGSAMLGTGEFASMKGLLPYPVSGKIILHFGSNTDPVTKISRHEYGITISTSPGATVSAVCEGTVAGFIPSAGFVIINHGEYSTIYRGLRSFKVKKGEKVRMGQALGNLRIDPDDPDYSQLKFEIHYKGRKCNPEEWLR